MELIGLAVLVGIFSWLHDLAGTDIDLATSNAQSLQAVERAMGIDVELAANHWLAGRPLLLLAAVWYYRLYYVPLAIVLVWLIFRRPALYRRVRGVLIVMMVVALLLFWLMPMAPPRFAMPGIVDIVADHDVIAGAASRDLSNGQNHFSAFPSMHVGWSLLCAYAAWLALRRRNLGAAVLVWLFPLLMIAVVITTGNHYVLDVAGSLALLAVSIAVTASWHAMTPIPRAGRV